MSKILSAAIDRRSPSWILMFYAPNEVQTVLFRSGQRGEAEAAKQRFARLIGSEFRLEVVFDDGVAA